MGSKAGKFGTCKIGTYVILTVKEAGNMGITAQEM